MTRAEALEKAIAHVDGMSRNARGFLGDGITLSARVDAVERFVAILLADEESADEVRPADEPWTLRLTPERFTLLCRVLRTQLDHGPTVDDGPARTWLEELER